MFLITTYKYSLASFTVNKREADPTSFCMVQLYCPVSAPSDNWTSSTELVRGGPWLSWELGGTVQVTLGDGAPAAMQSSDADSPTVKYTSNSTSSLTNWGDSVE